MLRMTKTCPGTNNKELLMVISSIKSPLWIESQDDFENKCFLRELLQKCSGN